MGVFMQRDCVSVAAADVKFIDAFGFTVIVYSVIGPSQVPSFAITEMVASIGAELVLVVVKEGMFPDPDAASPMEVLLLVHLKVFGPGVTLV